jgi:hypothetical protein
MSVCGSWSRDEKFFRIVSIDLGELEIYGDNLKNI